MKLRADHRWWKKPEPPLIAGPARRHVSGVSLFAAYAAALSMTTPVFAKTPGEVHCYNENCPRVKSVDEMKRLVGMEEEAVASFYDDAAHDSMNVGTITSSGEEFDADSDSHAASSEYPDGTELLIWNPKNRRAAHVRVNDFGPFYARRTLDVTRGVAEKLDFIKTGATKLRVIVLWAPELEDARFRRQRSYARVEGYLGALDHDQVTMVKNRLIATAPIRNGYLPAIAQNPARVTHYNFDGLPAYASSEAGNSPARRLAAIMNAPRWTLTAAPPSLSLTSTVGALAQVKVSTLLGVGTVVAAQEIELPFVASTDPMAALARDGTIEPTPTEAGGSSVLVAAILGAKSHPQAAVLASANPFEAIITRVSVADPLVLRQLLLGLGLLSLATVALRIRRAPARVARRLAMNRQKLEAGSAADLAGLFANRPATAAAQSGAKRCDQNLRDEAIALMERFEFQKAEAVYRQLLALRTQQSGAADPLTASAERQLADCLREQSRYSAAEPHYQNALAVMTTSVGEFSAPTADVLDEYAMSLLRQGYGHRAEALARRSVAIRRATDPSSREVAVTLSIVAETLRAQGQLVTAEIEHRTAWSMFIAQCGQDSTDVAASMLSLGTLLGELGRFGAAEELLNSAIQTLSSHLGPQHPATATGFALLGDLYRRAAAFEASLGMHRHALKIRESVLGARHPDTIESLLTLALIASEQGRPQEAQSLLDRGLDGLIVSERAALGPQSRIRALLATLATRHETMRPLPLAAE